MLTKYVESCTEMEHMLTKISVSKEKYLDVVQKLKSVCINVINFCLNGAIIRI